MPKCLHGAVDWQGCEVCDFMLCTWAEGGVCTCSPNPIKGKRLREDDVFSIIAGAIVFIFGAMLALYTHAGGHMGIYASGVLVGIGVNVFVRGVIAWWENQ